MSRRGIRFLTQEVVTEVGLDELEALRDELRKIVDGAPRLAVAAKLVDRLDSLTSAATFEPHPGERFALLRATDHLQNLGHKGELLTLRGRLIGTGDAGWIAYRLRFPDARPPQDFTSYSLAYEVGDRVVTPGKDELRIIGVDEGDPPELVVDDWRPGS